MRWTALVVVALAGCATIDVYHWEPRSLPPGAQPLAVVASSLNELRNVTWSYGEPDPDPTRRAKLEATVRGIAGNAEVPVLWGAALDLPYDQIVEGVRMVTQSNGLWTVYIYDRLERRIELEFGSWAAARHFLDASYALAREKS